MLLPGLIFIITGFIMKVKSPKEINSIYGYRTQRSMKNQANWEFAQVFSAKKCRLYGAIFFTIGLILSVLLWGKESPIIPFYIFMAVIISFVMIMVSTEGNLKKFEKTSNKKIRI